MFRSPHRNGRAVVLILLPALMALPSLPAAARAADTPGATAHGPMMSMSDADMRAMAHDWYTRNAPRGANSTAAAVDTFTVQAFIFDADHNLATQVDTVRIVTGQTIAWKWVNTFHTTTNGTGANDPNVGTLWDQPIDNTHQFFSRTFNTPGTFPFFCRFHELNNMKGVIIVTSASAVPQPEGGLERPGFRAELSPNPTSEGTVFRFAIRTPGPVTVEVFDVAGRRVAVPVDKVLDAGDYTMAWDGRTSSGARASTGWYYLRLTAPGVHDSRSLVVAR